jgi:hypothetical protein
LSKEAIASIPLSAVLDVISFASRNVSILMNRKLEVPPVLIKVVQPTMQDEELALIEPVHPDRKQIVYEIWKVFLNKEEDNINQVYIIISADYDYQGYGQGEWNNLQYNGFYSTVAEAENEINGYLQ